MVSAAQNHGVSSARAHARLVRALLCALVVGAFGVLADKAHADGLPELTPPVEAATPAVTNAADVSTPSAAEAPVDTVATATTAAAPVPQVAPAAPTQALTASKTASAAPAVVTRASDAVQSVGTTVTKPGARHARRRNPALPAQPAASSTGPAQVAPAASEQVAPTVRVPSAAKVRVADAQEKNAAARRPAVKIWAPPALPTLDAANPAVAQSRSSKRKDAPPVPSQHDVPMDAGAASGVGGSGLVFFAGLLSIFLLAIPTMGRWLRPVTALGLSPAYVAPGDRPG